MSVTTPRILKAGSLLILALFGQANAEGDNRSDRIAATVQDSFVAKRQAGMDRITQDYTQRQCTQYADAPLPGTVSAEIMRRNRATIKPPSDGVFLGDVTAGEAVARRGRGLQSSDDPAKPAGGNCYACHELAPEELAFGTLGPSLRQYGKLRGDSQFVLDYTWGKLYNSNAHIPCSNMPRFGHQGILTEQQLKDVMAYLLDPASPVNQ
jgi:L-cysteine S-thiosulfotransferase